MGLVKAVFGYRAGHHCSPYDRDAMVDYRNNELREDRRGRFVRGGQLDDDYGDNFVPLRRDGAEAAATLPTHHYGALEDAEHAGDFGYGTDDDECVDPWHGTDWSTASAMFANMRTRAAMPPAPGPNSAPNPNVNVNRDSCDTNWAATERRQRRRRAASSMDDGPSNASGYTTPPRTAEGMPDFSVCMQASDTQVGDAVPLDAGAQSSFAHAASLGETIEPELAAMLAARARSPQPAAHRGLTTARATAPGLGSTLINTIRGGRAARAAAGGWVEAAQALASISLENDEM